MLAFLRQWTPFLLVLLTLAFVEAGVTVVNADAKSQSGGRSFSSPAAKPMPPPVPQSAPSQFGQQRPQQQIPPQQQPGGFGRGFMGGLLGGALGGMLFGSMFGASGSGMGILPLLLLGGIGYFLYKRFANRPSPPPSTGFQPPPEPNRFQSSPGGFGEASVPPVPPVPPVPETNSVEQGLTEIRLIDPGFDDKYFLEVASDVFFKVQAGWMRRDLAAYRHLLGNQLAAEYEGHFASMRALGQINKLESIAIRKVEIVAAGSREGEDFVTVLFLANLLDFTVDDKTGALVSGSMTEPVKFTEEWTWARPIRTEDWKLEGIKVVEG
jgi:predicted lipid-binding transport protein (Tim44 family)